MGRKIIEVKVFLGIASIVCIYLSGGIILRHFPIFAPKPCARPIVYSLGSFDERFGISREQFLTEAAEAAGVWGTTIGKTLFAYSETPQADELKLNLVYDYRQQATEQLARLGIKIDNDKGTYDAIKAKYESLVDEYNREKPAIQSAIDTFNARKAKYEQTVDSWNSRGGAPPSEFRKLEDERLALNDIAAGLNRRQETFNRLVNTINAVVTALNRLVRDLNLNVSSYNSIGAKTGEEFSEGEYIVDGTGKRINIYQFDDLSQLKRVLEHEFGHALGLEHVEDRKAIMYRLNEGKNESLANTDIAELHKICTQ